MTWTQMARADPESAVGGGEPHAYGTRTTVAGSQDEIRRTVRRYECAGFAMGHADEVGSFLEFRKGAHRFRFIVPAGLGDREERRRWRVVLLWIKAGLERHDCGDPLEVALFGALVLGNGQTADSLLTEAAARIGDGMAPSAIAGLLGRGD